MRLQLKWIQRSLSWMVNTVFYCTSPANYYGGPEVHSRFPFPVRHLPSFVPRFSRFPFPVRHLPSFVPLVFHSPPRVSRFAFSVTRSPFALICASRFPFSASRFLFPVRHSPSFVPRVSRTSILSSFFGTRLSVKGQSLSFGLSRNDGPRCDRVADFGERHDSTHRISFYLEVCKYANQRIISVTDRSAKQLPTCRNRDSSRYTIH